MLSIENTKILTYGWLIIISIIYFIKHLGDSGLFTVSPGVNLSLTLSKFDYSRALLPLMGVPIIYLLKLKYEADIKNDKENIKRNSVITIVIVAICILSYYLTRWKIINGPYNYSKYLHAPSKKFSPIFKSFTRLN